MRHLLIGLLCAALALGCGGTSSSPGTSAESPGAVGPNKKAPKGGKGGGLVPPPLPNVGPPPK